MRSLRDLEEELGRGLRRLEPRTRYAEVMAETSEGHRLRLDRATVSPQPLPSLGGFVFRAWTGDAWIEAAASGLSERAVGPTVERLLERLPATPTSRDPPGPLPPGGPSRRP